jgi:hypothetical protein
MIISDTPMIRMAECGINSLKFTIKYYSLLLRGQFGSLNIENMLEY